MSIKKIFSLLLKGIAISSIGFSSYSFLSPAVKAEDFSFQECPDSDSDDATFAFIAAQGGVCLHTPSKYEFTIYEMGLCTTHPLTGDVGSKVFNKSSCVQTMSSPSGAVVDLAPGNATSKTANLPSANTRPASNNYGYAYILLNTEFNLKGSFKIKDGPTYYSKPEDDEDGFQWGAADPT